MTQNNWETIKQFYEEELDTPGYIVDFLAVYDIIKATVGGLSNEQISSNYGMSVDYIEKVNREFLEFDGWGFELDYSPLHYYELSGEDEEMFIKITEQFSVSGLEVFYYCQRFVDIRKELEKYYES